MKEPPVKPRNKGCLRENMIFVMKDQKKLRNHDDFFLQDKNGENFNRLPTPMKPLLLSFSFPIPKTEYTPEVVVLGTLRPQFIGESNNLEFRGATGNSKKL